MSHSISEATLWCRRVRKCLAAHGPKPASKARATPIGAKKAKPPLPESRSNGGNAPTNPAQCTNGRKDDKEQVQPKRSNVASRASASRMANSFFMDMILLFIISPRFPVAECTPKQRTAVRTCYFVSFMFLSYHRLFSLSRREALTSHPPTPA